MKLNTDASCGFKIRTIGECGILQVKSAVKKILQNKPVDCYSSHYKPWCPCPVRTLGKGSLFKSRAGRGRLWQGVGGEGVERNPKKPISFHSGHFPKRPLTSPAGSLPPLRVLFICSSLLKTGAGRSPPPAALPRSGPRHAAGAAPGKGAAW